MNKGRGKPRRDSAPYHKKSVFARLQPDQPKITITNPSGADTSPGPIRKLPSQGLQRRLGPAPSSSSLPHTPFPRERHSAAAPPANSVSLPQAQPPAEQLQIRGASVKTVRVDHLHVETSEADIRTCFEACGIIESVQVTRLFDSVSCFIHFETKEGARAAIDKFHNQWADGKQLHVAFSDQTQHIQIVGQAATSERGPLRDSMDVDAPASAPSRQRRPVTGVMYADRMMALERRMGTGGMAGGRLAQSERTTVSRFITNQK